MFGWKIYKVGGHSMEPTLKPGQYVLARSTSNVQPGDIVICNYDRQLFIKRVKSKQDHGYNIKGDNTSGQDSRDFGLISPESIVSKVIWH